MPHQQGLSVGASRGMPHTAPGKARVLELTFSGGPPVTTATITKSWALINPASPFTPLTCMGLGSGIVVPGTAAAIVLALCRHDRIVEELNDSDGITGALPPLRRVRMVHLVVALTMACWQRDASGRGEESALPVVETGNSDSASDSDSGPARCLFALGRSPLAASTWRPRPTAWKAYLPAMSLVPRWQAGATSTATASRIWPSERPMRMTQPTTGTVPRTSYSAVAPRSPIPAARSPPLHQIKQPHRPRRRCHL